MSFAAVLLPSPTWTPQGAMTDSAKLQHVKKNTSVLKLHCYSVLISFTFVRWKKWELVN